MAYKDLLSRPSMEISSLIRACDHEGMVRAPAAAEFGNEDGTRQGLAYDGAQHSWITGLSSLQSLVSLFMIRIDIGSNALWITYALLTRPL
ncbi:hypothetical protein CVT25_011649 [Psilocybe cyanescens]|uniref:Uncharacterized protein n=1 Tax=Psilocybe cyanescens TaxID=93625 RepID=A0A409WIN3_PSICY|nr:hypothetical protein CVT25_011649 [Psilocybe cyanescens]